MDLQIPDIEHQPNPAFHIIQCLASLSLVAPTALAPGFSAVFSPPTTEGQHHDNVLIPGNMEHWGQGQ